MEKYTAKQYAEMYGGHTMTEEEPKGLEFMQTLGEARMFRSCLLYTSPSPRD